MKLGQILVGVCIFLVFPPLTGHAGIFDTLDKIDRSLKKAEDRVDQSKRMKETTRRVGEKSGDVVDVLPDKGGEKSPSSAPSSAPPSPPPLPKTLAYHFASVDGGQTPLDTKKIELDVKSGKIRRDTLAWSEGMSDWAPAGEIKALAPFFASQPPPLSPQ